MGDDTLPGTNPRKTRGVRELGPVDIRALREAVLAIPESLWDEENALKPNRFEKLDRTRHIVFRFVKSVYDWRDAYDRPIWQTWKAQLEPVLRQATAPYGYRNGSFPRIMLANMAPGGVIHKHRDMGPAARWPHKIHIPLLTNERVSFFIAPDYHHFPEGQAFEVNNLGVHAVKNEGDTARIHLIFEYYDCDQAVGTDHRL
jgi:hypothetical protein